MGHLGEIFCCKLRKSISQTPSPASHWEYFQRHHKNTNSSLIEQGGGLYFNLVGPSLPAAQSVRELVCKNLEVVLNIVRSAFSKTKQFVILTLSMIYDFNIV